MPSPCAASVLGLPTATLASALVAHGLPPAHLVLAQARACSPGQWEAMRPRLVAASQDAGVGWIWGDPRPRDSRVQHEREDAYLRALHAPPQHGQVPT